MGRIIPRFPKSIVFGPKNRWNRRETETANSPFATPLSLRKGPDGNKRGDSPQPSPQNNPGKSGVNQSTVRGALKKLAGPLRPRARLFFTKYLKLEMLEYNEITEKKYIEIDGEPYEVTSSHVFRKQQRKPVNATKLRNLVTGKVSERSFHVSEKVEEADLSNREIKYLYNNKGEWWFCEISDPSKRFSMPEEILGVGSKFIKENTVLNALVFNEKIIGVKLPIKVDLKVKEAHPAVKGDTARGGTKQIILETGATILAPLFVKEGDTVRVNTETGEYTDRVSN